MLIGRRPITAPTIRKSRPTPHKPVESVAAPYPAKTRHTPSPEPTAAASGPLSRQRAHQPSAAVEATTQITEQRTCQCGYWLCPGPPPQLYQTAIHATPASKASSMVIAHPGPRPPSHTRGSRTSRRRYADSAIPAPPKSGPIMTVRTSTKPRSDVMPTSSPLPHAPSRNTRGRGGRRNAQQPEPLVQIEA